MAGLGLKLLGWFTGGGLNSIVSELGEAHARKLNAKNNSERIKAEEEINALNARKEVLIKGKWAGLNTVVTFIFAAPYALYLWKLIVWDKILKAGTTDSLGEFEMMVAPIVIGYFFLTKGIKGLRN
jgi:hypothetical protein